MTEVYITFRSLTRAQLAAAVLAQSRIDARFLRAPEAIARQGCGYALLLRRSNLGSAIDALRSGGVGFDRVFARGMGGRFQELWL